MRTKRATYISIQRAADILGVSTRTVRRRMDAGYLKGYRVGPETGTALRFDEDEVYGLVREIYTVRRRTS